MRPRSGCCTGGTTSPCRPPIDGPKLLMPLRTFRTRTPDSRVKAATAVRLLVTPAKGRRPWRRNLTARSRSRLLVNGSALPAQSRTRKACCLFFRILRLCSPRKTLPKVSSVHAGPRRQAANLPLAGNLLHSAWGVPQRNMAGQGNLDEDMCGNQSRQPRRSA